MVCPAIIVQQREGGIGQQEAACSRHPCRVPGAGIPIGAATGGSRAEGNDIGMPRCTSTDSMAHDGRWIGGH
jgi:hypothetical protein